MAPMTLEVVVGTASHELGAEPEAIESPLSDDMDLDSNDNAHVSRLLAGDGDREGPEVGGVGGAVNPSSSSKWRSTGTGSGGTQRGRQPTRDVVPLKTAGSLASSSSAYHHNSVLTAYRSRSLSAGRTRPRPSFDIVQDVYDRIGVTYNPRGELLRSGTTTATGSAPSFGIVAPATPPPPPAAAPAVASTTPSVPTTTSDASERDGLAANAFSTASGGTRIYRAAGSTVSSPLREKFQKRYFPRTTTANAAAGTGTNKSSSSSSPRAREALLETLERRRSRSLTRTMTTAAAAARLSKATSTAPSPTLGVLSTSSPAGAAEAIEPATNRGTWPPSSTDPSRNSSPTHSQPAGQQLLKKKQGTLEAPVALLPPDSSGANAVVEPTLSSDGVDESAEIMPSVKDRMAIFGGNAKSSTAKSKGGKERSKVRDYPPKIDIYATQSPPPRRTESSEEMEDEKKDDSVGDHETKTNKTSKRTEGGATAGVGSSQSSGGAGSRFSRNSTPNATNMHPQASLYRTAPLLVTNFTAEPQTHAARYVSTTTPQPRQAPQQRIGIKYTSVIEIPVDETGAVVSGNDNNSFVSSLGADETAIVRQPTTSTTRKWQLQPSPMSPVAAAPIDRGLYRYGASAAAAAVNMSPVSAPTPCVPAPSSLSAKPSTLTTDWMEKMVEERLQAHLAVLEVHMDNQLRHATMQIEKQMTTRLASLEDKISALVQAQQQPQASAGTTEGTSSNPIRGGYVPGARMGW